MAKLYCSLFVVFSGDTRVSLGRLESTAIVISFEMIAIFVFLFHGFVAMASDPDPIFDFCLPVTTTPGTSNIQCKNASEVVAEDFVFSGIKFPGKFSGTRFSSTPVNSAVFPGLNTLGMSLVRADFDIGGVNVPHYHPRATEVAFVLEGKIYSGFVDSGNRVFAKVIGKGEVMVFPRGLIHFQMNVGDGPAAILGSFNSQNPGLMKVPSAIFGSGIEEVVLEKAFGLKKNEVDELRKRLTPHK